MKVKKIAALMVTVLAATVFVFSQTGGINIEHLLFLRDDFNVKNEMKNGYWIYADLKSGEYVHADASGEGVTCVDDVARAGIFYLNMYENTQNTYFIGLAKECTDFVSSMKYGNGDYYNFVFGDGSLNINGITSRPSKNWWALRAMWLFAKNFEIYSNSEFKIHDEEYSETCLTEIEKTAALFRKELDNDGLIRGYTDLTSLYVLALGITCKNSESFGAKWLETLKKCSEGLISKTREDSIFPGIIDEGTDKFVFHGWGSRQVQALAIAYEVTGERKYIEAAEKMALGLYPSMVTSGPFYELRHYGMMTFPLIAYAAESAVSSLYELNRVTEKEEFGYLACLCASFFFGNNELSQSMTGKKGEGFDGMEKIFINRNSGAESTISYLISLSLVERLDQKFRRMVNSRRIVSSGPLFLEAENMDAGLSAVSVENKDGFSMLSSTSLKIRDDFKTNSDNYDFFVFGDFQEGTNLKAYIGSEKTEKTVAQKNGCIHIGNVKCDNITDTKITLVMKSGTNNLLNQLAVLPGTLFQVIDNGEETYLWAFNRKAESSVVVVSDECEITVPPETFMVKKIDFEPPVSTVADDEEFLPEKIESGIYRVLNLSGVFDNDGIGFERQPSNLDNFGAISGAYLPADEIRKKSQNGYLFEENIPFKIEVDKGYDNISANGHLLIIDDQCITIHFAGCCDHGTFSGELEIEYADSGKEFQTISFPDWCSFTAESNTLVKSPFRYTSKSQKEWIECGIFIQSFSLNGKDVRSIRLPTLPTMHIFAITYE